MGVLVVANFQQYVNSLDKQEYNKFLRPILVCSKLSQNHTFQNRYHRTIQICTYYHRTLVDVFCISVSFMKITFYHLYIQILWHTFLESPVLLQKLILLCFTRNLCPIQVMQFSFHALCWLVYLPCNTEVLRRLHSCLHQLSSSGCFPLEELVYTTFFIGTQIYIKLSLHIIWLSSLKRQVKMDGLLQEGSFFL